MKLQVCLMSARRYIVPNLYIELYHLGPTYLYLQVIVIVVVRRHYLTPPTYLAGRLANV